MSQHKKKNHLKDSGKRKPWPVIFLLGGGLLLLIGAFFIFSKPSQSKAGVLVTGAPGLKVDQEKVDLGDVKLGRTVEVSFELTNVGDQTLRFTEAPYIDVLEGC